FEWLTLSQLSLPRWTTGDALSAETLAYLLYRQSHIRLPELDPAVAYIVRLMDRHGAADLAAALLSAFSRAGASKRHLWCLPLACALGTDRLLRPLLDHISSWLKRSDLGWAPFAISALALLDESAALVELERYAHTYRD